MTLFEVRVDMENKIFELSGKQLCVARCPADVHKLDMSIFGILGSYILNFAERTFIG